MARILKRVLKTFHSCYNRNCKSNYLVIIEIEVGTYSVGLPNSQSSSSIKGLCAIETEFCGSREGPTLGRTN